MAGRSSIQSNRLNHVSLDELLKESLAKGGRAATDGNARSLESRDLRLSIALASADNGTSVTHTTSGGSADTSNEADGRLVGLVHALEELGGIFLGATADLTNHDDTVGLGVLEEDVEAVDKVGSAEGITADTNDERLAKAGLGGLVDGLVGEGSGTRHDTDAATLVDEAGHDTDFTLALGILLACWVSCINHRSTYRRDDTRAVGANKSGLALCLEHIRDANHI